MKKNSILFAILTFLFINQSFAFEPYQTYRGSPLSVGFLFDYYKTEANFDSGGKRTDLPSGNSMTSMDFKTEARYRLDSDYGIFASLNITNSASEDPYFSRKNSALNDILIGADYLFIESIWYRFFGKISYLHPLHKNDPSTDDVLTSDGASELHPEVFINLDFEDNISSFMQTGLNLRGSGLSGLLTYGLGIEKKFESFGLGAQLNGRFSIKNDEYVDQSSYRDNLNYRVDGGSYLYNSVNPSSHDIGIYGLFPIGSSILTKVFIDYNLLGSNSPSGFKIGFNLNWLVDSEESPKKSSPLLKPSVQKEKTNFKIDTNDGVNQDYFKPVHPIQKEYIQQIEGSPKSLKEATTPDQNVVPINQPNPVKIKLKRVKKK